jgi:peptide/nickel transport system permease protein
MGAYLIRRTLISIVTLIAISMVIFTILYLAPGDPLSGFANNPNVPPELRQRLRAQMGIDDPLPEQYTRWATQYIQGNWGISYSSRASVRDYVFHRIPVTIGIVGSAFVIGLMIAIPIGVISAIKQYSLFDQFATTFAFLGFSLPTFFTGILMIVVFSVKLGWLPFIYDSTVDGVWAHVKQSIMPVAVLGLAGAASLTRFVRASMLEVISQDYVRTARAKGLKDQSVVILHAMRNAMIPVVTIVALQIPEIFGGAIITEQIFRVNGLGQLLITGIQGADLPLVQTLTFIFAFLIVAFNLIADLVYGILDPRIRYE